MYNNTLELKGLKSNFTYYGMPTKKDIFYDEDNNNLLLVVTQGECTVEDAINSIKEDGYFNLISSMNNNKNLIIELFGLESTVSDYIVYFGFDSAFIEGSLCPETLSLALDKLKVEDNGFENRYCQEYKDGKFIGIV